MGPFRAPCFHNEGKGNRPDTRVPEPVSRNQAWFPDRTAGRK